MKKIIFICTIGMVLLAVIFYSLNFRNSKDGIPLLHNDATFQMNERQIIALFGLPKREHKDGISVQKILTYDMTLCDKKSTVSFYVNMDDDSLWKVAVDWETDSSDQATTLLAVVLSNIQEESKDIPSFHAGKILTTEEGELCVTMSIFCYEYKLATEGNHLLLHMRDAT